MHFRLLGWLLALALLAAANWDCAARAEEDLGGWQHPYHLTTDVTYAEVDGVPLKLDIYQPVDSGTDTEVPTAVRYDDPRENTVPAAVAQQAPIAVFIHGGAWRGGDKQNGKRFMRHLTAAGYLGISIDYRLTGLAAFPAQIYDCKAAIRWVRVHAAEYGGDPDRIAVCGASAGGHLAALLGTSNGVAELEGSLGETGVSSDVQLVCDWFGPSDLAAFNSDTRFDLSPVIELLDAIPADAPDKAQAASPVHWVDASDPPFLIIHGEQDPVVPFDQSVRLRDTLAAAGVEVELIPVPNGAHGAFWATDPSQQELINEMIAFFDMHLR